jgi:predicted RNA binding protein YcfA (HicA-like mRNA interferase family)
LPKAPRLTPQEAEAILLKHGFNLLRSKGSHRIYGKATNKIIIPFHQSRILHPKIVKQLLKTIENSK